MGTYLRRRFTHPQPWVPGVQRGAHIAHQLVPQRHPVVRSPPCCPKYLRIWRSWPVVLFLRMCFRIPRALCRFRGVLTSFCRRRHQRATGQRRVMPEEDQDPTVPEREAHQERGPEDRCHQKPQAAVRSSCYKRNAITSSYSSTRGFPPAERRRQPATCHTRLPQRLTKTVSQQVPQAPSSSCPLSQRKSQPDSGPGDTRPQRPSSRNRSPSCDRPRKRKCPLLPRRQGDPLTLPPPPELGYRVRPEDISAEKKVVGQRISRALWGDPEATSGWGAPEPLRSSLQPAAGTGPSAHIPSRSSSASLPVTSAGSAGPSACTPTAMAPKAASDTDVTPMDWSPVDTTDMDSTPMDWNPVDTTDIDPTPMDWSPSDTTEMDPTPMDWTPSDTTASDPTPMDTTPPSYAHSSGAPTVPKGGKQAAGAPAQAPTSAPGQQALASATQATLNTQASTQAGTQANTRPAIAAPGPSGTATQLFGGSVGLNSWKRSSRATLVVTTGPNPQNNPVLRGTTVPMVTPILGGAPKHSAHPSSRGLGTTSNVASSGVSLLASTPSFPSTAMGTSRAGRTTNLSVTWAVSAGPSTSKSSGLAPKPASHTDVTPMDTTPPK